MVRIALDPLALVLILSTSAFAQSGLASRKITAPIKDRGTYHVATGTWTREGLAASFTGDVLFNNTAPSGYVFATSGAFNTVDHGRIPSTSSPASPTSVPGTEDIYEIECFQLSYCSEIPIAAGGVTFEIQFFDQYGPCTDISAPVVGGLEVASFVATGLSGGSPSSAEGCWVSHFDLANTTLTFLIRGDGDGDWNNQANFDSFGWALRFPDAVPGPAGNGTGPVIAGNCPAGGIASNPTMPQQGFQTAFGGSPGATDSTGLGTNDFFWIDGGGLVPNANGGCFFFGSMGNGCTDPSIVGPAKNPFGGYWLQLFGSDPSPCFPAICPTRFCGTTLNSTGSAARLDATATDPNADLVFTSAPVPNTTGQFYYGPMMLLLAGGLGEGFRCIGGMTTRMLPLVSAGMMMLPDNTAVFTVNYTAPYAAGLAGTQNFQHWFREPAGTSPTGSNSSDAVTISF